MLYKEGMYCKHFKGRNLLEKNIYKIISLGVLGKDVDTSYITYTGDGNLDDAENLVVYQNIFQDNKFFAREYNDISGELLQEKQEEFKQMHKVEPLLDKEIDEVLSAGFQAQKRIIEDEKHSKKNNNGKRGKSHE